MHALSFIEKYKMDQFSDLKCISDCYSPYARVITKRNINALNDKDMISQLWPQIIFCYGLPMYLRVLFVTAYSNQRQAFN